MNLDLGDELLAAGTYVARLDEVERFQAKSGWDCVRWNFLIAGEGDAESRYINSYTTCKPGAEWKLRQFLKVMNLPHEGGLVTFDEKQVLGTWWQVTIKQADGERGRVNDIDRVLGRAASPDTYGGESPPESHGDTPESFQGPPADPIKEFVQKEDDVPDLDL